MITLDDITLNKDLERVNKRTNILSAFRVILILSIITFIICFLSLEETILYLILSKVTSNYD